LWCSRVADYLVDELGDDIASSLGAMTEIMRVLGAIEMYDRTSNLGLSSQYVDDDSSWLTDRDRVNYLLQMRKNMYKLGDERWRTGPLSSPRCVLVYPLR
jgi:hypothetical protein